MLQPFDTAFQTGDAPFETPVARSGKGVDVRPVVPRVGEEPPPGVRIRFVRDQAGPACGALFDAFAAYDLGRQSGGAEDLRGPSPLAPQCGEQIDEFGVVADPPVMDAPYGG